MHQIVCRLGLTTHSAPPDPLAGLGGGASGEGKEVGEGKKEGGEGGGKGGSGGEGKRGEGSAGIPKSRVGKPNPQCCPQAPTSKIRPW